LNVVLLRDGVPICQGSSTSAGAITTVQLRKVLNDVSEKITGDSLIVPSVEDYFKDWLKSIAKRNRAATIERYGKTVRLFLSGLNGRAQKPITGIMPKDIENFLNARLETGVAPQTAIIDLKTLNTAFRRAERSATRSRCQDAGGGGATLKTPVSAARHRPATAIAVKHALI